MKKMKQVKIVLAFVFGCLTALAFGFAVGAAPNQRQRVDGMASLRGRLNSLEERAHYLEQAATAGQLSNKVVAPFEVVDGAGKRVFSVEETGVHVYAGKGGKGEAVMTAGNGGGNLAATSASADLVARLAALQGGIQITENLQDRINLGKNTKQGDYRLRFVSRSDQVVAGIGEDPVGHGGLALIYNTSGNLKARMAVTTDARGVVDVLGGNKLPIAQLTESKSGGGKLWIGNAAGVGMVEAGDAGGYGIVRAGPKGFEFIPTPGLALPGNVIVGKR